MEKRRLNKTNARYIRALVMDNGITTNDGQYIQWTGTYTNEILNVGTVQYIDYDTPEHCTMLKVIFSGVEYTETYAGVFSDNYLPRLCLKFARKVLQDIKS